MAEILRQNGYNTGAFGKWHQTAPWEVSASGPYDRWPTHQGFEKFYGFIGGETNQWEPAIFDGVIRVPIAGHRGVSPHHGHDRSGDQLGEVPAGDHAGEAVHGVLRDGCHPRAAPRPKESIEKYKGKFDERLGQAT